MMKLYHGTAKIYEDKIMGSGLKLKHSQRGEKGISVSPSVGRAVVYGADNIPNKQGKPTSETLTIFEIRCPLKKKRDKYSKGDFIITEDIPLACLKKLTKKQVKDAINTTGYRFL